MRKKERKDIANVLWVLISVTQRLAEKLEVDLPEFPEGENAGEKGKVWDSLNDFEHDRYER